MTKEQTVPPLNNFLNKVMELTKDKPLNAKEGDDTMYEISEDMVKGWLFNAIFKRYNPKSEEEAQDIILKKWITCRMITSWNYSYATILTKNQKVIAQAREDYFLVPVSKEEETSIKKTRKKKGEGVLTEPTPTVLA